MKLYPVILAVVLGFSNLYAESVTYYLTVYSSRTTANIRSTMSKMGYVSTDSVHNFERTYFYQRGNTNYWMLETTPKSNREKNYISTSTGTGVSQLNAIAKKENADRGTIWAYFNPFHPQIDRPFSMDRSTP